MGGGELVMFDSEHLKLGPMRRLRTWTIFIISSVCMTDSDIQVEELEEILSPLNKEQKTDWKTKIQALIHVIFIITSLYYSLLSSF